VSLFGWLILAVFCLTGTLALMPNFDGME